MLPSPFSYPVFLSVDRVYFSLLRGGLFYSKVKSLAAASHVPTTVPGQRTDVCGKWSVELRAWAADFK